MEDDFIDRLKTAAAFVWIGLHLIYFGCINNGSDNSSNPVWGPLHSMVVIEKGLLVIAAIIGIILILYNLPTDHKRVPEKEEVERPVLHVTQVPLVSEAIHEPIVHEPSNAEPLPKPEVIPIIEPTIDEVRAKAIRGILRRWR